jgi:ATP-binding cassette, subfamily B, bacterial
MLLSNIAARGPLRFLLHHIGRRLPGHLLVLAAVLAAVGCAIGAQYAIKNLVDTLGIAHPTSFTLWAAVALLLCLVAGDQFMWRFAGWVASYVFVAVGGDIRLELFGHLSGHGARYFADRFPGALASRISTAANSVWTIENSLAWTTIPPAAAVASSIAVLAFIDGRMAVVLALIVTILGAAILKLATGRRHLHELFADRAANVSGELADIVGNIGLVRAFGSAQRERKRLAGRIGDEMGAHRASLQSLERVRLFHAASVFAVTAGVLVWSVALWRAGHITTGGVVLSTTLGMTVLHASRDLAMAMVELLQHFAKLGEAVQVLCLPHEMPDAPDARPLISLGGAVTFVNASFSYPNGERVLQDFNLHIHAGERVGFVGRSGAGKSTVIALIQRLYDLERGHVLIDEQDVAKVTQASLRQSIAVVHQDISLFHRSVLENLRYGRPDATDSEVYSAAEQARCTEFIERLPQGFATIVGERGLKLSGGERQRLAIARAFLRRAPIILLDEATSALDTESEQAIQAALTGLFNGRTVIAIAHRLSTVNAFDRIVVLERGHILEQGPPAELLRRKGVYSRMYLRQLSAAGRT